MPGFIAILLAYIFWGAGSPIFKNALTAGMPPMTLAFIRFFGAGVILAPFVFRSKVKISGSDWRHIILGAFWGIIVNIICFLFGLEKAPSINAPLIGSFGPVLLYILSLVMLHEKPHPQMLKGIFLSIFGVLIIVFSPIISSGVSIISVGYSAESIILGNLLFCLATLGAVMFAIENKQISKKIPTLRIVCIQFFIGSIIFMPFMFGELRYWNFSQLTQSGWSAGIYGILFSSIAAYALITYGLKKMDAQATGVLTYIAPVAAVVVAIPLLGELPDVYFIFGAVLILIGMFISERHPHYRKIRAIIHRGRGH